MSLDKLFDYQIKDMSSDLTIDTNFGNKSTQTQFKEILLTELDLKLAIPVTDFGNHVNYTYGQQKELSYYENNELLGVFKDTIFQINFDTNKNIKKLHLTKHYKIDPGYSAINIILEKNNEIVIPTANISFFKNCVQLFANINSEGTIEKIKSDYSEFAAAYCAKFTNTNVQNLYEGIVIEHYKEKEPEKLGEIGTIVGYSNIDLNKIFSLFVLANEVGFKKDYKLDYYKTIKNLINTPGSNWEHLIVYEPSTLE